MLMFLLMFLFIFVLMLMFLFLLLFLVHVRSLLHPHPASRATCKMPVNPNVNQFGHVSAFGRKTTKPAWFDRDGNGGNSDIFLWQTGSNKPKQLGTACPFIHGVSSEQRERKRC